MIREETHFVEKILQKQNLGGQLVFTTMASIIAFTLLGGCAVVMQLGSLFCSFLKHKMADLKTKIPWWAYLKQKI